MLVPQLQQHRGKQTLSQSSCGSRFFTWCDVSFRPVRQGAHGGHSCAKCPQQNSKKTPDLICKKKPKYTMWVQTCEVHAACNKTIP